MLPSRPANALLQLRRAQKRLLQPWRLLGGHRCYRMRKAHQSAALLQQLGEALQPLLQALGKHPPALLLLVSLTATLQARALRTIRLRQLRRQSGRQHDGPASKAVRWAKVSWNGIPSEALVVLAGLHQMLQVPMADRAPAVVQMQSQAIAQQAAAAAVAAALPRRHRH